MAALMYYWTGTAWEPIAGGGGGTDGVHIVSETTPPPPPNIGDLWIQPNAPDSELQAGPPGPQGEPGLAATIEVGSTLTIDPGLPAEVTNQGTESKALLSFKIPQGMVGDTGPQGIPGPEGIQGPQGIQGPPGLGITFKGTVPTEADLPTGAAQGDLYVVSTPEPAHGFVWDADLGAWVNSGPVQGPQGIQGPQGVQGPQGPQGITGDVGPAGPTAVSSDPDNISQLGSDGLIYTKLPFPQDLALGGVFTSYPQAGKYVSAINEDGTVWLEDLPALTPATATVLGGVKIGSGVAVTADGTISVSSTLNPATTTVLGGVKVGTGLTVTADGTISVSPSGGGITASDADARYVNSTGDVMTGPLRFAPTDGPSTYNGQDCYLYYGSNGYLYFMLPSSRQAFRIENATGQFSVPHTLSVTGAASFASTVTVPSTATGIQFGTTTYNVFGGSGGVAIRSNTTNISTYTNANITNMVPIVTPATGSGIQFGSGGAAFGRGTTGTKINCTGMIELPATAPAAGEAVRRDFCDANYAPKVLFDEAMAEVRSLRTELDAMKSRLTAPATKSQPKNKKHRGR